MAELPVIGDGRHLERAERVLTRLRSSLALLLGDLPPEARSVRGLGAWCGVSHAVCQRVLAGCRPGLAPTEILTDLPGPDGIQLLLLATRDRMPDSPHLVEAAAALRAYRELLGSFDGRRRGLAVSLRRDDSWREMEARRAFELEKARAKQFDGSQVVARCWAEALVCCRVVRAAAEKRYEQYVAAGWWGLLRQPGHMALMISWVRADDGPEVRPRVHDGSQEPIGAGGCILTRFSSSPLPELISRETNGRRMWLIDPDARTEGPLDVIFGFAYSGELGPNDPYLAPMIPRVPGRHLVLDTYFHEDFAQVRGTEPALTLLHGGGAQPKNLSDRWYDAMPLEVRPERLGRANESDGPPCALGMGHLARHLIGRLGDDPSAYVGYRLHVPFPLWGQQHSVVFDLHYGRRQARPQQS